jgi:hypothetical protein
MGNEGSEAADLCANVGDLLNRTTLTGTSILRCNYKTVGALTEFLVEGIVLIDDEGLLKGLESMSLSIECHNL